MWYMWGITLALPSYSRDVAAVSILMHPARRWVLGFPNIYILFFSLLRPLYHFSPTLYSHRLPECIPGFIPACVTGILIANALWSCIVTFEMRWHGIGLELFYKNETSTSRV